MLQYRCVQKKHGRHMLQIIQMAVCRNLENLENIGSDRKKVLRARRTRRPNMAKFQNFQNSNRYDQNVGKVLISWKMGLKKSKHPFWAQISLISFFLNFGTKGVSPYWPPIWPTGFFFCTHRYGSHGNELSKVSHF